MQTNANNEPENIQLVYVAEDIQQMLRIGKTNVYSFLHKVYENPNPPFRVIMIGRLFRVPKQSFDDWLNSPPVSEVAS